MEAAQSENIKRQLEKGEILDIRKSVGWKDNLEIMRLKNNPDFQNWFGDSVILDENNDPLPLFHGTTVKFAKHDYIQFESTHGEGRKVDSGFFGSADYFTQYYGLAMKYATKFKSKTGYITTSFIKANKNEVIELDRFCTSRKIGLNARELPYSEDIFDFSHFPDRIQIDVRSKFFELVESKLKELNGSYGHLQYCYEQLISQSIKAACIKNGIKVIIGESPYSTVTSKDKNTGEVLEQTHLKEYSVFDPNIILTLKREILK
jgi:hypothetical protein